MMKLVNPKNNYFVIIANYLKPIGLAKYGGRLKLVSGTCNSASSKRRFLPMILINFAEFHLPKEGGGDCKRFNT